MTKRNDFLTSLFYSEECETINVFNKILSLKIDHQKHNYEDGTFLDLQIQDTPNNRELLGGLIRDFEMYSKKCSETFISPIEKGVIDLSYLQYHHAERFTHDDEIMFYKPSGEYIFRGGLYEE